MATVLVTGANKGIGLELVRLYAEQGNNVVACCRIPSEAEALSQLAQSNDIDVQQVHVGDGDSVAELVAHLGDKPIDILINNAGTAGPAFDQQTVSTMDFEGWLEAFNVNTMTPVRVMQALLGNLKSAENSKVVNITSQMGALSLDMTVGYAYCTSKAALNKFMRMAAIELGKEGVCVCVIHPGWVKTDMGGPGADISATESAEGIVTVIAGLDATNNGSFWKWNGEIHDW
ncbi:MAG: Short chain dehydrogenase [Gammaproteobacteria bacterium]|jgi:NAD(P)-dependent dehydrogenase (short-subunit alcohol dehydrogenase family)|nr:Short chain dehydrogenase [Gammaproteobacteria bacterium]